MPSVRKRIGYLPSPNVQDIITKIANNKNLSQSKVVGILVEEALVARGIFDFYNTNDLIRNNHHFIENKINSSSLKYNDIDELISDEGITYTTKKEKQISEDILAESKDTYKEEELFEQFKQFIIFQKIIKEKQ
tara:strand:+ start:1005 stop:1406 length:402 start_codon:yes stop_codon:yes gene_type:complete